MKKLIPVVLLALFALASCEKDPDMGKLDGQYMVYTNYDTKTDFKQFSTFYLPDSILMMGSNKQPEYWAGVEAAEILAAYARNMVKKGFVEVEKKDDATLGVQISYVKNNYSFTDYEEGYGNSWWWGYPGYWGSNYWGNWGGGYYPYAVNYSFSTNSFITEIVNLTASEGNKAQLPVVWSSYMGGLRYSTSINQALAIIGVDQAFTQSPYLTNK